MLTLRVRRFHRIYSDHHLQEVSYEIAIPQKTLMVSVPGGRVEPHRPDRLRKIRSKRGYPDNSISYEEGSALTSEPTISTDESSAGTASPGQPTTRKPTTNRDTGANTITKPVSDAATTTAPSTALPKTPAPATEKDALSNSLHALTVNKKLTVGYIGGSVTVGTGATFESTGSWRALTTHRLAARRLPGAAPAAQAL